MKKKWSKENCIKALVVSLCLFLTGCGSIGLAREATFESAYENVPEEEPVNIYTSQSYGVVEGVDTEDFTMTVYLLDRQEQRVFQYDATTIVQDRYGSYLTMAQLTPGEIVDVAYNSELERVGNVKLSTDGFCYDNISNFSIDEATGNVQIGDLKYELGNNVKVFSGGDQFTVNQILKNDIVSFRGIGKKVVSVIVNKGHGYLYLTNHEALTGGWIEIGQTSIYRISENMLLTIPEGEYVVRLTAGDIEEYRDINIERNKETVLDLGEIKIDKPETGIVSFVIWPEDAKVYIDNNEIDASYMVRLPLGLHKITVEAEGYQSLSEYFEVTQDKLTIRMSLDEEQERTVSGNNAEQEGATITIQAPAGAEVYQDNLYMGIAPLTYKKTAGTHTITLRKEGYITQSYQIVIEEDDKDVYYSFPDLESEEKTTVSSNNSADNKPASVSQNASVSGNRQTVSGNN